MIVQVDKNKNKNIIKPLVCFYEKNFRKGN